MQHPVTGDHCIPATAFVNAMLALFMNKPASELFLQTTPDGDIKVISNNGSPIGVVCIYGNGELKLT